MSSRAVPCLTLVAILCACSSAPPPGKETKAQLGKESFTAAVVRGPNMRMPGSGSFSLTINVEKWTSVEERKRLLQVFKEGGKDALLKELRQMKAGYIVPPAYARWPSWEIDVAATIDTPEGRVVRLFTERPITFEEAYRNTMSTDFEFGVVELKLKNNGAGEGTALPAVTIALDDQGQIVFQTTRWATGPYKLIGVRKFD